MVIDKHLASVFKRMSSKLDAKEKNEHNQGMRVKTTYNECKYFIMTRGRTTDL